MRHPHPVGSSRGIDPLDSKVALENPVMTLEEEMMATILSEGNDFAMHAYPGYSSERDESESHFCPSESAT